MNQLLINIAKRLVCKAIKLNNKDYSIDVSYKYLADNGAIIVTVWSKEINESYYFFDNILKPDTEHLEQYKTILKKIRSREL